MITGRSDHWYAYHMPNGYHAWNSETLDLRDFDTWDEAVSFVYNQMKDGGK